MGKPFPQVQPGGSLILAYRVKDKNVLVVGGGEVRSYLSLSRVSLQESVNRLTG